MTSTWRKAFLGKFRVTEQHCFLWSPSISKNGSGAARLNKKQIGAHRLSWLLANGEIPKGSGYHGTCVLPRCDVRACVNPQHLFLGSTKDNNLYKIIKGRANTPRGEAAGSSKLKEHEVLEIRRLYNEKGLP